MTATPKSRSDEKRPSIVGKNPPSKRSSGPSPSTGMTIPSSSGHWGNWSRSVAVVFVSVACLTVSVPSQAFSTVSKAVPSSAGHPSLTTPPPPTASCSTSNRACPWTSRPMSEATVHLSLLPHQHEMLADETDGAEIALVGPLGSGKTMTLAMKTSLCRMANRGVDGMLVVPTYDMFRQIHRADLPAVWDRMGLRHELHASDKAFSFPDFGNRLWIRSAEHPDRLAGPNLGDVHYDEPGQIAVEAYHRGSARARHPDAKYRQVCLYGTPEGLNWFADLFDVPTPPRRTIRAAEWHRTMAHYPAKLRDIYGHDPNLLAAYGKGRFVPMRAGRAYHAFDRSTHVAPVTYERSMPVFLACDFNVDTMRWVVLQLHSTWVHVLGEIALGANGTTEGAAQSFVAQWREHAKHLNVVVTGDAAGKARSTSGKVDYATMREVLEPEFRTVRFDLPNANPPVKDRVNTVNYHLSGRGREVTIDPSATHLIRDLERVQWTKNGSDLDKNSDPMLTHASDAFGYGVYRWARAGVLKSTAHIARDADTYRDPIIHARF